MKLSCAVNSTVTNIHIVDDNNNQSPTKSIIDNIYLYIYVGIYLSCFHVNKVAEVHKNLQEILLIHPAYDVQCECKYMYLSHAQRTLIYILVCKEKIWNRIRILKRKQACIHIRSVRLEIGWFVQLERTNERGEYALTSFLDVCRLRNKPYMI